jgi:hypothetical protein
VAAAALAVVGCSALAVAIWSSSNTASKALDVKPLGAASTNDWSIGSHGILVTNREQTQIMVQLTRTSPAERTPSLTGNFDGSGGGEAQLVTCSAAPQKWEVRVARTQTVTLNCDTRVGAAVVKQMYFVYAGQA